MRTASFTLGLIGGILGLLAGILVMSLGGTASAFGADGGYVVVAGLIGILAGVAAIVGASVGRTRTGWGGTVMLIAMIVGFLATGYLWIPAGICLLVAGVCAYAAQDG